MLSRVLLIGLGCLAVACSDDSASERTPAAPLEPPNESPSPPPEVAPEVALAEVVERATVPGTLRLVVLRPETLLGSEERTMTRLIAGLDATDLQVLRDEPSEGERGALNTFFGGGEWMRPPEWAQHDVVLVLEFVEPTMFGRRESRPHTLGLRTAALWSAGNEEPAYFQQSRLAHGRSILEHLDTPRDVGAFLVQLSLDARSRS